MAWRKPQGMPIAAALMKAYCAGLLPGDRKSLDPMAGRLTPDDIRRTHQSCTIWWQIRRGAAKRFWKTRASMFF